jgi:FtsZ-interacting cell division protein YlmF
MSKQDIARPMTLHVEQVSEDTSLLQFLERRRVTVVDLELTKEDAVKLIDFLTGRLAENYPGSIRVRVIGRLQLN